MPSAVFHAEINGTNGLHKSDLQSEYADARTQRQEPLKYSGSLEGYQHFDNTPVIGRQFTGLQIREILHATNRDQMIADVAATVSRRGVVFLKDQDVTPDEMKTFVELLSTIAGCPKQSGLHVHPLTEEGSEVCLSKGHV